MDASHPRNQADDEANPIQSGETFVGTIRWFALAIGVACLALLTLVGNLAHAAVPLRHGCAAAMAGSLGHAHRAAEQPLLDAAHRYCGSALRGRELRDDQPAPMARPDRTDAAGRSVAGRAPTT